MSSTSLWLMFIVLYTTLNKVYSILFYSILSYVVYATCIDVKSPTIFYQMGDIETISVPLH